MPYTSVREFVGHVLLPNEMSRKIMRVLVSVAVAEIFHEFGGSIAQMERHGQVAGTPHCLKGVVDAVVC